jgi:endonuclease-3
MLSSQTKDTMTIAAMDRLLEQNFTVQYGLDIDVDELGKIIYPVGFWRVREQKRRKFLLHYFFFVA